MRRVGRSSSGVSSADLTFGDGFSDAYGCGNGDGFGDSFGDVYDDGGGSRLTTPQYTYEDWGGL